MATPQQKNSNVRLLACLVDEYDTGDSDYRFLVDGRHVKDDRTFEPILLSELFPPFPIGDWNNGRVARDPVTNKATFIRTEKVQFTEVKSVCHNVNFDELNFSPHPQGRLRQRVHVVVHPTINDGEPVLMKLAVWPWEIPCMETETAVYQWICDKGGPNGRIIGFITEWLGGTRPAEPRDLDGCKKTLARLHQLGIKHGDINRRNFLVREREGHEDEVVLIDFETTRRDRPHVELEDEMKALKNSLDSADT
ncbi:hypothetical protein E4U33_007164 [Claviceps sp. LM78 group G4]|nr:hypothetical protein E4U33_007164 [Claviceps sp. LM78 group G4]